MLESGQPETAYDALFGIGVALALIPEAIGTFSWESIRNLRKNPKSSSLVMTATVVVVVATHNLALGVMVGVLISSLVFAYKIGRILYVGSNLSEDGLTRQYQRPRTPGDISRWRRRASFND